MQEEIELRKKTQKSQIAINAFFCVRRVTIT